MCAMPAPRCSCRAPPTALRRRTVPDRGGPGDDGLAAQRRGCPPFTAVMICSREHVWQQRFLLFYFYYRVLLIVVIQLAKRQGNLQLPPASPAPEQCVVLPARPIWQLQIRHDAFGSANSKATCSHENKQPLLKPQSPDLQVAMSQERATLSLLVCALLLLLFTASGASQRVPKSAAPCSARPPLLQRPAQAAAHPAPPVKRRLSTTPHTHCRRCCAPCDLRPKASRASNAP